MIRQPPNSPLFPYTPLFLSLPPVRDDPVVTALHQHDRAPQPLERRVPVAAQQPQVRRDDRGEVAHEVRRSEEHTSELQSRQYLVCRLLLEKKKNNIMTSSYN